MLVLSRKQTQSVVIDGDIRVTIVKISGNKVRLGIEAPPDVAIKRSELLPHNGAPVVPDEKPADSVIECTSV